jgi:hypothetical protein
MISRFSLSLIVIWATLLGSSCRADIFLFDDSTGTLTSFKHLPDSPGGQLHDTLTPVFFPTCPTVLPDLAMVCSFLITGTDGFTTANVGGFVVAVDSTRNLVREEIDYNATPGVSETFHLPPGVYVASVYSNEHSMCPPSICKSPIFETPGIPEALLTIPWLDLSGALVRVDTFVIIPGPPFIPEPSPLAVSLGLGAIGLTLFRKKTRSSA